MEILKKIAPHALVILIFYIATIAFVKPEVMDGKSLTQDDMLKFSGMARENSLFQKETGEQTMWNGRMFGGMPAYLFYASFDYGPISFVEQASYGFFSGGGAAHLIFLPMLCFYLMMLCFRVRPWIAASAAIAFSLSTYNLILIDVGHVTKLRAIAYLAVIIGGMRLVFHEKKYLLGAGITALAMTLELRSNHAQITYYFAFVAFIYGLSELIFALKAKEIKDISLKAGVLILAFGLGTLTHLGHLSLIQEYTKHSTRGEAQLTPNTEAGGSGTTSGLDKDYAFRWSEGVGETFTLIIPYFYGGSTGEDLGEGSETYQVLVQNGRSPLQAREIVKAMPLYHGDQPGTAGPIYAGAVICFLFVLGLLICDHRYRWWILGAAVLMMFIGWGKNFAFFNYTMFDHFPGFNKFRSVSMALSITVLLMTLLAGLGLERVVNEKFSKELQKNLFIAAGATGGLALIIGLFGSNFMRFTSPFDQRMGDIAQYIIADRKGFLRADAFRTFIFVALAAGLIWLTLKEKVSVLIAVLGVGLLMVVDLWAVGKRYLAEDDFKRKLSKTATAYEETPADTKILGDKEKGFRVMNFNNPFAETHTSYFHRSVGGYFAVKMMRYNELIDRRISADMQEVQKDFSQRRPDFEKYRSLNMLNAKYFKLGEEANAVIENPAAYGPAWFVSRVVTVQNPDDEMKALGEQNPKNTAVIDASKFPSIKEESFTLNDSTANITLEEYAVNHLKYKTSNSNDGLAVFSEIYYPHGWTVLLDGKDVTDQMVRADYVLRALPIPKGEHTIEFKFRSEAYHSGNSLTMIVSYLVFLLFVGASGFTVFQEMKNQPKAGTSGESVSEEGTAKK